MESLASTDVLWFVGLCAYANVYYQRHAIQSSVIFHFSRTDLIFFPLNSLLAVSQNLSLKNSYTKKKASCKFLGRRLNWRLLL